MRMKWLDAGVLVGMLSGGPVLAVAAPAQAGEEQPDRGDRAFLEQALRANQLELKLGQLAADLGGSHETRTTGQTMVKNHTELGQQLAELAKQSGGAANVVLTPEQQAIFDRVASQSGSAFDGMFKQTVDAGHVKELAMYRDEQGRATNPKLREFAERRVTKLQETVARADAQKAKKKHDW
jgi:putative membrane protein